MKIKKKPLGKLTALAFALSASAALGQTAAVCTDVGGSTPTITIAVASDFDVPAQKIAMSFLATPAGSGKAIRVCHNSTGLLVEEINAGNSPYSLFLAANTDGPTQIDADKRGNNTSFPYASGIPVLWSVKVAAADLMNSDNTAINQSNVTSLAIGNPSLAPYGTAAEEILKEQLGQWEDPGPGSWITQYDNIALTKTAIENKTQDAGIISKAQVCDNLNPPGGGTYQFASPRLQQDGIQLVYGDATATATASDFKSYLLSSDVQARIVNEFCFDSLSSSASNR